MESPRSPKRRRILSSINPPETNAEDDAPRHTKRDRTMTPDRPAPRGHEVPPNEDNAEDGPEPQDRDTEATRPTKFRFKSKSSRSSRRREGHDDDRRRHRHRSRSRSRSRDRDRHRHKDETDRSRDRDDDSKERKRHRRKHRDPADDDDDDQDKEKSHRHHHHRHHHHRRRRHRSKSPSAPAPQQPDPQNQNPFQDPPLSPTTAFRESLFDAMADDEGAAYWESVYGQPIHIYAPPNHSSTSASGGSILEHMTDDEYAAYVRQKMWEKTHAGLLEARARREREKEEARKREEEKGRVAREMERCLRRGEERRRRKGWRERWEGYVRRWAEWEAAGGKGGVEGIPWPVEVSSENGGEGGGIQGEAVRAFFVNGLGLEELGEKEFAARLKEERVRWHPDKVQQRLGGQVEEKVMRDMTAIFQAVDALWNDTRKSGG